MGAGNRTLGTVVVTLLIITAPFTPFVSLDNNSLIAPSKAKASEQAQSGINIADISVTATDQNVYRVSVRVTDSGEPLSDAAVNGFVIGDLNYSITFEEHQPGLYVTEVRVFAHGIYDLDIAAEKEGHGRTTATETVTHRLEEFNFDPVSGWYVDDRSVTVSVEGTTYQAYLSWDKAASGQDGQATWLVLTEDGHLAPRDVTRKAAFAAMVKFDYLRLGEKKNTISRLNMMIDLWRDDLLKLDFDDYTFGAFFFKKLRNLGVATLTSMGVGAAKGAVKGGVIGAKAGAIKGLVVGGMTKLLFGISASTFQLSLIHDRIDKRLEWGAENATAARRIVRNYDGGPLTHRTARELYRHDRQATLSGFGAMYTRTAMLEGDLDQQLVEVVDEIKKSAAGSTPPTIEGTHVKAAFAVKDTMEFEEGLERAWVDSRHQLNTIRDDYQSRERQAALAPELRGDLAQFEGITIVGDVSLSVDASLTSDSVEPGGTSKLSVTVRDSDGTPIDARASYQVLETDISGDLSGSDGQYRASITAPSSPGGYSVKIAVEALGETVVRTVPLTVRPGNIRAAPETWEIGQVTSGTIEETSVTIENTGDVTTDISVAGGAGLSITDAPGQLSPGETGSFTARLDASNYDGAPIVVSFSGGKLVIPVELTVVKDEDLTDSWTEELSDEFYDCAFISDVTGPDDPCGERDWSDDIRLDSDELAGLASATLTIEYRPGGPEKQDNPLEVYFNGEQVDTIESPSDNDEFASDDIDIPVSDVQADNTVRLETDGASGYDIGDDTEFSYTWFEEPFLVMEFGEFDQEVEPGNTVRVPVKIANDGGRPATDILLGLGSDTDYDAIEVVKWPDGYGTDDARSLDPKQNDVRYFIIRLLSETTATVEIAAGGDETHTDRTFTIRPSNDPPTLSDVGLTPQKDVASAGFDYRATISDPDGDTVDLTLQVFDPSDGSWKGVRSKRVAGKGQATWRYDGFDSTDEDSLAEYRIAYHDGNGHSGTWGSFPGPFVKDDDNQGPTYSNWQFPKSVSPGDPIPVSVEVSDPAGVQTAELTFAYPNGTLGVKSMESDGAEWTATIPPAVSDNRGGSIAFSAEARDDDNNPTTKQSLQRKVWVESGTLGPSVGSEPGIKITAPTGDNPATVSDGGSVTVEVRITLRGTATRTALERIFEAGEVSVELGRSQAEIVNARLDEAVLKGNTSWVELIVSPDAKLAESNDLSLTLQRSNPCWPADSTGPCTTEILESTDTNEDAVVADADTKAPARDRSIPPAVAHWSLDEVGATVPDESRNGHHGTVHGNPERISGVVDGAYRFDGNDDFVLVNMSETLKTTGSFTLSLWIRTTRGSTVLGLYTYNGNGQGEGVRIKVNRSRVNFQARHSSGFGQSGGGAANDPYYHIPNDPPRLTTGVWHHLALRYDAQAEIISLLVNGTETASLSASKPPRTDDTYLLIGARPASDGGNYPDQLALDHFAGDIDEVRIYHRALNASSLSTLSDPTMQGPTTVTPTETPATRSPTVSGQKETTPPTEEDEGNLIEQLRTEAPGQPGFGVISILSMLVLVVILARRRSE